MHEDALKMFFSQLPAPDTQWDISGAPWMVVVQAEAAEHPKARISFFCQKDKSKQAYSLLFFILKHLGADRFCYKWQVFAVLWGKQCYPSPRSTELAKLQVLLPLYPHHPQLPSALGFPSPAKAVRWGMQEKGVLSRRSNLKTQHLHSLGGSKETKQAGQLEIRAGNTLFPC